MLLKRFGTKEMLVVDNKYYILYNKFNVAVL